MIITGRHGLGRPVSRRREVEVSVAPDGVCADWRVRDGDLADAGALLTRLYPEVSQ